MRENQRVIVVESHSLKRLAERIDGLIGSCLPNTTEVIEEIATMQIFEAPASPEVAGSYEAVLVLNTAYMPRDEDFSDRYSDHVAYSPPMGRH